MRTIRNRTLALLLAMAMLVLSANGALAAALPEAESVPPVTEEADAVPEALADAVPEAPEAEPVNAEPVDAEDAADAKPVDAEDAADAKPVNTAKTADTEPADTEEEVKLLSDESEAIIEDEDGLTHVFADLEAGGEISITLAADITFTHTLRVREGREITLNLNGHTLTVASQGSPDDTGYTPGVTGIIVEDGGLLSVTDRESKGGIVSESDNVTLLSVEGGLAYMDGVSMSVSGYASRCLNVKQGLENRFGHLFIENAELTVSGTGDAVYVALGGNFTAENSTVTSESVYSAPVSAVGYDVNADNAASVWLIDTTIYAYNLGLYAYDAQVTLRGAIIDVTPDPEADEEDAPDVHAIEIQGSGSHVTITDQSVVTASGGDGTGIALNVDVDARDDGNAFDTQIKILNGAQLNASGSTAFGIRGSEGAFTLNSGFVYVEGDSAYGVSLVADEPDGGGIGNAVLTLSGDTEVSAVSEEDTAIGVWLTNAQTVMEDVAKINAKAPHATGVFVLSGNLTPNGSDVLIRAEGTEGEAVAVDCYVSNPADTEEIDLKWMAGNAEAVSGTGDAYAVRVVLPRLEEREEDASETHAVILPHAGKFDGKVDVVRLKENSRVEYVSVENSQALKISGGSYSVKPAEWFIDSPYIPVLTDGYYLVTGFSPAQVFTPGEDEGTPRFTLTEALDAAKSGDTIRLYQDVTLTKEEMPLTVPADKALTLELNGFEIRGYDEDGSDTAPEDGKSVLLVEGELTVDAVSQSGINGDSLNYGGAIRYGHSANTAGGVVVRGTQDQRASFTMYGGSIADNMGRVGGIEAYLADVSLVMTEVDRNTGTEVGGIEGVAASIYLGDDLLGLGASVKGNVASGPFGVGGISVSSDPEDPKFFASLIAFNSTVFANAGKGTGGIEAYDSGVSIFGGSVEDNWGGRTGGLTLTDTAATIGEQGAVTRIQDNDGGFVGGIQVGTTDDGKNAELNLIGGVRVVGNVGNRPMYDNPDDYSEDSGVGMDVALFNDNGAIVPLTLYPDVPEEDADETDRYMALFAGIYTIVRDGETPPENGRSFFQLYGDTAGGGTVYALDGTLTTQVDKDLDIEYLLLDAAYVDAGQDIAKLERTADGAYQIVWTNGQQPDELSYSLTVKSGDSSSDKYAEGDTVTVTANAPGHGKKFDKWTWTPDVALSFTDGTSANSRIAKFLMPGTDLTLTATYQDAPGGNTSSPGGCYVATAVYGSYDCPEVWTLRRFRDNVLAKSWYGRLFIRLYYAVSPTAVRLFGEQDWFQNFFRGRLDQMVSNLQADGFESTPYQDIQW